MLFSEHDFKQGISDAKPLTLEPADHDEAWLQALIDEHPECLPIAQIAPGVVGPFKSICREMPLGTEFLDNLLIGPRGDIVIVETKLWQNPEARRSVLSQTLGYAVTIFGMSFEAFQAAALSAHRPRGGGKPGSLHALFGQDADVLPEHQFNDSLARNLRLGRAIVLIVGNGIREEAARLLDGVDSLARFQFTLGLISVTAFRVPATRQTLIVPTVHARTQNIIRHVVEIRDTAQGTIVVSDAKGAASRGDLTELQFLEALEAKTPGSRQALGKLIDSVAPLKIYPEFLNSLNFKWASSETSKPINLMYIRRDGQIWTDAASWFAPRGVARRYVEDLAAALGAQVYELGKEANPTLWKDGKSLRMQSVVSDLDAAIDPMTRFVTELAAWEQAGAIVSP
jgi:hypothetical protein